MGLGFGLFFSRTLTSDFRNVCAITDLEKGQVTITGGKNGAYPDKMVAVYSEDGYMENLTELNEGRFKHACTSYLSNNGSKVCYIFMFPQIKGRFL